MATNFYFYFFLNNIPIFAQNHCILIKNNNKDNKILLLSEDRIKSQNTFNILMKTLYYRSFY